MSQEALSALADSTTKLSQLVEGTYSAPYSSPVPGVSSRANDLTTLYRSGHISLNEFRTEWGKLMTQTGMGVPQVKFSKESMGMDLAAPKSPTFTAANQAAEDAFDVMHSLAYSMNQSLGKVSEAFSNVAAGMGTALNTGSGSMAEAVKQASHRIKESKVLDWLWHPTRKDRVRYPKERSGRDLSIWKYDPTEDIFTNMCQGLRARYGDKSTQPADYAPAFERGSEDYHIALDTWTRYDANSGKEFTQYVSTNGFSFIVSNDHYVYKIESVERIFGGRAEEPKAEATSRSLARLLTEGVGCVDYRYYAYRKGERQVGGPWAKELALRAALAIDIETNAEGGIKKLLSGDTWPLLWEKGSAQTVLAGGEPKDYLPPDSDIRGLIRWKFGNESAGRKRRLEL